MEKYIIKRNSIMINRLLDFLETSLAGRESALADPQADKRSIAENKTIIILFFIVISVPQIRFMRGSASFVRQYYN